MSTLNDSPVNMETNQNDNIPQMNFFQRVLGIIISPAETMRDLKERPRVVFPIFLTALAPLFMMLTRYSLYKEFMRRTAELSAQIQAEKFNITMSPEQIEQTSNLQAVVGLFTTPIGAVVGWIIGAAILFGVVKIFGGEGKFKQFLSITGYAAVISLLNYILITAVSFVTNNLYMDVPLTSVANFFPESMQGSFIFGFLKAVDLFSIWSLIVTAIGITVVGKLSKTKAYSIMTGLFVVQMIIGGFAETAKGLFS